MEKLVLSLVLLLVILIVASVGVWILAKKFGLSVKFRMYLVSVIVIIVIAILASSFINSYLSNKNNSIDNKEKIIFEL